MPQSKTAAATLRAQAARIAELTARNEVLEEQLRFLARAAGCDQELAQIQASVMRRHADVLNPASPVPDPPEGPPSETTEQALAPDAMDDPSRPGTTPNSLEAVPAAQTTTAITPGVEIQTPPATNLVDVTAPVQGTNPSQDGGVPLEQRRIETDVRIDPDPLKAHGPGIGGQGDNGAAFPWVMDARGDQQQPQQKAASSADGGAARTYGSLRLARLRVQAGLAQGEDVVLAEQIRADAALSDDMIRHEIDVLSQVRPEPRSAPWPARRFAVRRRWRRWAAPTTRPRSPTTSTPRTCSTEPAVTYTVTLNGGDQEVVLPNGLRYQGAAQVVLSDAQYAQLSPHALASLMTSVPSGGIAAYQVTIAGGQSNVVLPDKLRHQAGDVVTLSDDEYSTIPAYARASLFSSTVVTVS